MRGRVCARFLNEKQLGEARQGLGKTMKRQHLFAALPVLLGALGAMPAYAQSNIDTVPQWNGTNVITDWGTTTATYGQTFTATNASGALNSFTFYTRLLAGQTAQQYQAYVYEWNAGAQRITGPALFTSAVSTMHSNSTSLTAVTVGTGGIRLVAGKQYVFFFTTSSLPAQAAGSYNVGGSSGYAGGGFVFANNNGGLNFALLSTQGWRSLVAFPDLAMLMRMSPTLHYAMEALGNRPAMPAAGALDAMLGNASGTPLDTAAVVTAFGNLNSAAALTSAVNQTQPLFSSSMNSTTMNTMREVNRVIQARVDGETGLSAGDAFQGDRNAWMKPYGSLARQESREGALGVGARSYGVAFGADRRLSASDRVGIAAAFGQVKLNSNGDANNSASIQTYSLIGYGRHAFDERTDLSWQVDGGLTVNDGRRVIDFGGLNRVANSHYFAYTAHAGAALSRSYQVGADTTFAPALRADFGYIHSNGYREEGAGALNLAVRRDNAYELVLGLDARMAHKLDARSTLTASLGLGYDTLNRRNTVTAAYLGGSPAFTAEGLRPSPWILRGGVGVNLNRFKSAQVAVRYDFEVRESYSNQTASVNVRVPF